MLKMYRTSMSQNPQTYQQTYVSITTFYKLMYVPAFSLLIYHLKSSTYIYETKSLKPPTAY